MSDAALRSRLIRVASELPRGSVDRRKILALLAPESNFAKMAMKKETEAFITWALQHDQTINANEFQRFVEKTTGRTPIQPEDAPKAKRGPLEVGETVKVDRYRNGNSLNVDECEAYHDQVGTVDARSRDGLTVRFDDGSKAFFNGFGAGKETGLYRWTPKADYQEHAVGRKVLIEAVYIRGGTQVPPRIDIEALSKYVEMGLARGEHRSDIYHSGYVGKFAYNKRGEVYCTLSSQQRDRPTSINPTIGRLFYIGVAGRRPGGWEADARRMGILV